MRLGPVQASQICFVSRGEAGKWSLRWELRFGNNGASARGRRQGAGGLRLLRVSGRFPERRRSSAPVMINIAKAILERDPEELVNELLFERIPFLFGSRWETYRAWRYLLGGALNVDPCEIVVIGSAAVGFSLSPVKRLKAFDGSSDVDVAIVSDHFFSEAWHYLRTVDTALGHLTPAQRCAVKEHQKRYIYWGCVATDRVLPILPFSREWLSARARLSATEPTTGRAVNFRVYKDFRALRTYQLRGLKRLRTALLDPEGGFSAEFP